LLVTVAKEEAQPLQTNDQLLPAALYLREQAHPKGHQCNHHHMLKFKTVCYNTISSVLTFIVQHTAFLPPHYKAAGWNLTPKLAV
jgi:hypothetical protein